MLMKMLSKGSRSSFVNVQGRRRRPQLHPRLRRGRIVKHQRRLIRGGSEGWQDYFDDVVEGLSGWEIGLGLLCVIVMAQLSYLCCRERIACNRRRREVDREETVVETTRTERRRKSKGRDRRRPTLVRYTPKDPESISVTRT